MKVDVVNECSEVNDDQLMMPALMRVFLSAKEARLAKDIPPKMIDGNGITLRAPVSPSMEP